MNPEEVSPDRSDVPWISTGEMRERIGIDQLPVEAVSLLMSRFDEIAARIIDSIQEKVAAYAGNPGGRRRQLIAAAVHTAIRELIAGMGDVDVASRPLHEIFAGFGRAEAVAGHDLDSMCAAFGVARDEVDEVVRSGSHKLSAEARLALHAVLGHYFAARYALVRDAYWEARVDIMIDHCLGPAR